MKAVVAQLRKCAHRLQRYLNFSNVAGQHPVTLHAIRQLDNALCKEFKRDDPDSQMPRESYGGDLFIWVPRSESCSTEAMLLTHTAVTC